jgi:hypothetical protein
VTISNVAMKPLIAILTGLHVLAHGIFGCCDHGLVAPSRAAPPCACHHAHHDDQHVPSSNPHDVADVEQPAQAPHQCVHASCHWLASSVGKLINMPDFSTPIPLVASLPKSCLALQAAEFWPDIATDGTSAPPLRLHLALGVLRI